MKIFNLLEFEERKRDFDCKMKIIEQEKLKAEQERFEIEQEKIRKERVYFNKEETEDEKITKKVREELREYVNQQREDRESYEQTIRKWS